MILTFQDFINGISMGGIYALLAVGFALIFSVLKFSNFAHGSSMMLCAYIGYFISHYLRTNLVFTILLTGLAGGCIGLLTERVAFRRLRRKNASSLLYFVSSFTLGMLITQVASSAFALRYYSYPDFFGVPYINIGSYTVRTVYIAMLAVAVVLLSIVTFFLYGTRLGIAIRALAQDIKTAGLMGLNVNMMVALSFFVAYFIGGVGGFFLGYSYGINTSLGNVMSKIMISAVLGGMGSVGGAVLGSVLVGLLEVLLYKIPFIGNAYAPVALFMLLIVVLIVCPQGLVGKFTIEKV